MKKAKVPGHARAGTASPAPVWLPTQKQSFPLLVASAGHLSVWWVGALGQSGAHANTRYLPVRGCTDEADAGGAAAEAAGGDKEESGDRAAQEGASAAGGESPACPRATGHPHARVSWAGWGWISSCSDTPRCSQISVGEAQGPAAGAEQSRPGWMGTRASHCSQCGCRRHCEVPVMLRGQCTIRGSLKAGNLLAVKIRSETVHAKVTAPSFGDGSPQTATIAGVSGQDPSGLSLTLLCSFRSGLWSLRSVSKK